jgi:hypothetical protein
VNRNLIGNSGVLAALGAGNDAYPATERGLPEFRRIRQKYLIYR